MKEETRLQVQFRYGAGGYVDRKHTYKPADLRWEQTGREWDVVAVKICD